MENIVEVKGFRIDRVKWQAAVDALLNSRNIERAKTEKKYWPTIDYHYDGLLTKLYSIRAHSRGRIHRKYIRCNYSDWRKLPSSQINLPKYDEFINANGEIKFELTLADQAVYIGGNWKQYELLVIDIDSSPLL